MVINRQDSNRTHANGTTYQHHQHNTVVRCMKHHKSNSYIVKFAFHTYCQGKWISPTAFQAALS
jgi:hypothetical protein